MVLLFTTAVVEDNMEYETQRWGVEIEAYGLEHEEVREIVEAVTDDVCVAVGGHHHTSPLCWGVAHDGSINRTKPFELRTPAMVGEREAWDKLRAVCKALRTAGAKVGSTCGLHVHQDAQYILKAVSRKLGCPSLTAALRFARSVILLYAELEPVIDSLMPMSRRRGNQYCTVVRGRDGNPMWLPSQSMQLGEASHYTKVSVLPLLTQGSIEYRQHSGTLLASKIIPWVKLTGLMQARAAELTLAEEIPSGISPRLKEMLESLGASDTLSRYWTSRQEALRSQSACRGIRRSCKCYPCRVQRALTAREIWTTVARAVQRLGLYGALGEAYMSELASHYRADKVALLLSNVGILSIDTAIAQLEQLELASPVVLSYVSSRTQTFETLYPNLVCKEEDTEDSLPASEEASYSGGVAPPYLQLTKALPQQEV